METKRIRASGDGGKCTKRRSKQRYTRKRKYHGKRKSINDDTVVQVEDQGAHSSINSSPIISGGQQLIVKQQQQRLLKFWTLVLNLIQIYYQVIG